MSSSFALVEVPVNECQDQVFVEARHRKVSLAETGPCLVDNDGFMVAFSAVVDPGPLVATFRAEIAGRGGSAEVCADPALESELVAACARGRAAFAQVALDDLTFVRYLARVLEKDALAGSAVSSLALEDLYLACACVEGCAEAVAIFAARYRDTIRDSIGAHHLGGGIRGCAGAADSGSSRGIPVGAAQDWNLLRQGRARALARRGCTARASLESAGPPIREFQQNHIGRRAVAELARGQHCRAHRGSVPLEFVSAYTRDTALNRGGTPSGRRRWR